MEKFGFNRFLIGHYSVLFGWFLLRYLSDGDDKYKSFNQSINIEQRTQQHIFRSPMSFKFIDYTFAIVLAPDMIVPYICVYRNMRVYCVFVISYP